jgi:hypothetical protein
LGSCCYPSRDYEPYQMGPVRKWTQVTEKLSDSRSAERRGSLVGLGGASGRLNHMETHHMRRITLILSAHTSIVLTRCSNVPCPVDDLSLNDGGQNCKRTPNNNLPLRPVTSSGAIAYMLHPMHSSYRTCRGSSAQISCRLDIKGERIAHIVAAVPTSWRKIGTIIPHLPTGFHLCVQYRAANVAQPVPRFRKYIRTYVVVYMYVRMFLPVVLKTG